MSSRQNRGPFILLSYPISTESPCFGNNPHNVFTQLESMERGDPCNSMRVTLFNHNGTHLDAPRHFDRNGKRIVDYRIEEFVFHNPRLIEVPKEEDEAIGLQDMLRFESDIQACDLLLMRTGFGQKRALKSYTDLNPWIDNEAARFLRQQEQLRAIGIDTISISSFSRLKIGEETHRILLAGGSRRPLPKLIIEDMDLPPDLPRLKRVFVIPLFLSEADSAPCTVVAEVEGG